jgi:hypothetical protein
MELSSYYPYFYQMPEQPFTYIPLNNFCSSVVAPCDQICPEESSHST